MKLTEQRLNELSKIEVRYFTDPDAEPGCVSTVVIKYAGEYRRGSEGWPDATYMRAMAKAGIEAFQPLCVIYDASELNYRWGNNINEAFQNVDDVKPPPVPVAVVIGPGCEPGMPHLWSLLATNEYVDLGDTVYFRSLETAWKFVEERLAETDS